jgi:hypothetical protein
MVSTLSWRPIMATADNPDYLVFWMTTVLGFLAWLI